MIREIETRHPCSPGRTHCVLIVIGRYAAISITNVLKVIEKRNNIINFCRVSFSSAAERVGELIASVECAVKYWTHYKPVSSYEVNNHERPYSGKAGRR